MKALARDGIHPDEALFSYCRMVCNSGSNALFLVLSFVNEKHT
jgi:hypothetical protein